MTVTHNYGTEYSFICSPCPSRDGLVVSMSNSHAGSRRFTTRPGNTNDHHENVTTF